MTPPDTAETEGSDELGECPNCGREGERYSLCPDCDDEQEFL